MDDFRTKLTDYLERTERRIGKDFICPFCGSGSKGKGTSGFKLIKDSNNERFYCFACKEHGDIYDLVMKKNHMDFFTDARKFLEDFYGVHEERPKSRYKIVPGKDSSSSEEKKTEVDRENLSKVREDIRAWKENMADRNLSISAWEYLRSRGFDDEFIGSSAQYFGYDPKEGRVAIIYDQEGTYCNSRAIDENKKPKYRKPTGARTEKLFREENLIDSPLPVIVTEGEMDCLSLLALGYRATTMGACTNDRLLVDALQRISPSLPIILAFDNDDAGKAALDRVKESLEQKDIRFTTASYLGSLGVKDTNEAFKNDREGLKEAIDDEIELAYREAEKAELEKRSWVDALNGFQCMDSLIEEMEFNENHNPLPTGFPSLDKALDGGLYHGLYFIGAASSMGKTTFFLQIADNVARLGKPVIIFSLEMPRHDLMSKSISRISYQRVKEGKTPDDSALSYREVITRCRSTRNLFGSYQNGEAMQEARLKNLEESMRVYREEISRNIYIHEIDYLERKNKGNPQMTIGEITTIVENFTKVMGEAPVVVIDYLQLIAPNSDSLRTEAQVISMSVSALKGIAIGLRTPVLCVSALNREGATSDATMQSFRDSSAIEYTADYIFLLQPRGLDKEGVGEGTKAQKQERHDLIKETRASLIRQLDLKIEKNRNGKYLRDPISLVFRPRYSFFSES